MLLTNYWLTWTDTFKHVNSLHCSSQETTMIITKSLIFHTGTRPCLLSARLMNAVWNAANLVTYTVQSCMKYRALLSDDTLSSNSWWARGLHETSCTSPCIKLSFSVTASLSLNQCTCIYNTHMKSTRLMLSSTPTLQLCWRDEVWCSLPSGFKPQQSRLKHQDKSQRFAEVNKSVGRIYSTWPLHSFYFSFCSIC